MRDRSNEKGRKSTEMRTSRPTLPTAMSTNHNSKNLTPVNEL